jgi:chemotaxis protein MotB
MQEYPITKTLVLFFAGAAALTVAAACMSTAKFDATAAERDRYEQALAECLQHKDTVLQRLAETESVTMAQVSEFESSQQAYREKIEEQTMALAELRRQQAEAESNAELYRSLLRDLQGLVDAGKLNIVWKDGRMVLVLPSDVLFESGSADLSAAGKGTVQTVGEALGEVRRKFQVEGHTDSNPIAGGRYKSNWELGAARAINVVSLLIAAGVSEELISAASFAATRPVADNGSVAGRAANRRIEIIVVPDLRPLPELRRLLEKKEG